MKNRLRDPRTKFVYPKAKEGRRRSPRRMSRKEKIHIFGIIFLFATTGVVGLELTTRRITTHKHAQIQKIDANLMTMTFKTKKEGDSKTIQWRADTEFMIETTKVDPSELKPLMDIIVWEKDSLFFSKTLKITASPLKDQLCSSTESKETSCSDKKVESNGH